MQIFKNSLRRREDPRMEGRMWQNNLLQMYKTSQWRECEYRLVILIGLYLYTGTEWFKPMDGKW